MAAKSVARMASVQGARTAAAAATCASTRCPSFVPSRPCVKLRPKGIAGIRIRMTSAATCATTMNPQTARGTGEFSSVMPFQA